MVNQQNICTRCGKVRIVVRTYTELVGNISITRSETSCPDLECQKKVNTDLEKEKEKREKLQSLSQMHRFARK